MPHIYANEADATSPYTLPNIWVAQLTADEVAESMEEELWEWSRKPAYRLANMNRQVRERMIENMVEELGITGGWAWCYCLPGCLPDSSWSATFATYDEAVADAKESAADY